jgi:hypothetical protein
VSVGQWSSTYLPSSGLSWGSPPHTGTELTQVKLKALGNKAGAACGQCPARQARVWLGYAHFPSTVANLAPDSCPQEKSVPQKETHQHQGRNTPCTASLSAQQLLLEGGRGGQIFATDMGVLLNSNGWAHMSQSTASSPQLDLPFFNQHLPVLSYTQSHVRS